MATETATGSSISISEVLSRTFGIIGRNPVVIFGIGLLLTGLPRAVIAWLSAPLRQAAAAGHGGSNSLWIAGIGGFIALLLAFLSQGAHIQAGIVDDQGRAASAGECLSVSLRRIIPLLCVALLMVLACGLAAMALIIPGIILFLMWSVAMPAVVAEGAGIGQAFGRSRALTKGARWKILGIFLVFFVLAALFTGFLILLRTAFLAGSTSWAGIILDAVVSSLTNSVGGVFGGALYIELRNWKDGAPIEALGDIFS
jgi:hypothetical protein